MKVFYPEPPKGQLLYNKIIISLKKMEIENKKSLFNIINTGFILDIY